MLLQALKALETNIIPTCVSIVTMLLLGNNNREEVNMDPPNWTEIIGLLTILLGWAEFIRRVLEARKRPKRKRKKRK